MVERSRARSTGSPPSHRWCKVCLYLRVLTKPMPGSEGDFLDSLKKDFLKVLNGRKSEPSLTVPKLNQAVEFERQEYFFLDTEKQGWASRS